MQCCKYAKELKCDECTAVYYQKCTKFIVAHAAYLSKSLRPFKFNSKVRVTDSVVWSRDISTAKSAALKFAIKLNSDVKKLTLSQVLSIVISNQEIEGNVFYIEYISKTSGDQDKIKGVLTSFIDDMTLRGACVSIYVGPNITGFNLEYKKL